MNHADEVTVELRRLQRLLREIHQIAEDASLTGALADGAPAAITRYNAVLRRLTELGVAIRGTFEPIPEDAGYGRLGIDAKLLASYIRSGGPTGDSGEQQDSLPSPAPDMGTLIALAPFMDRAELTEVVRSALKSSTHLDPGVLVGLAPFVEHGEIGRLAREHMKEWFRTPAPPEPPTPPTPPNPPEPPTPPSPPTPPEPPVPSRPPDLPVPAVPVGPLAERPVRTAETAARMRDVAQRLREATVLLAQATDPKERAVVEDEVAELAAEQVRLSEELAAGA